MRRRIWTVLLGVVAVGATVLVPAGAAVKEVPFSNAEHFSSLYVASTGDVYLGLGGIVRVYDAHGNPYPETFSGHSLMEMTELGGSLFIVDTGWERLVEVNPSTRTFIGYHDMESASGSIASGDGLLYVGVENTVYSYDPDTATLTALAVGNHSGPLIRTTPGLPGEIFIGTSASSPINIDRWDVSEVPAVELADAPHGPLGGNLGDFHVDAAGEWVYKASGAPYEFQILDTATLTPQDTFPADTYPNGIAYSASANRVAGTLNYGDHWSVAVWDIDGSDSPIATWVVGNPHERAVAFSPDGLTVYTVVDHSLFVLDSRPTPPTDLSAVAGDGEAVLAWYWDLYAEESVDDFVATANPGGQTCVVEAFSCTIDGLTNGVEYTFTVEARFEGVESNASAPSNAVTPGPAPAPPQGLGVGEDGSVEWSLGGGGPVDDLTIRHREIHPPAAWLAPLIVGGDQRPITNHRYGVKLFAIDGPNLVGECGGVLITREWVLTAAHCTEYQPYGTWYDDVEYFTVVHGTADWTAIDDDPDRYRTFSDQIIPHPDYDRDEIRNDLALVRLEGPVPAGVGDPIPIYPFSSIEDGAPAYITGWGLDDNGLLPDVLRGVEVTIDADCGLWPGVDPAFDLAMNLCTSTAPEGVCGGDSGGPVVVNDSGVLFLAGVVSFGSAAGCGQVPQFPDAHTRVTTYEPWIESHVGPLWDETTLSTSATSFDIGGLEPGRSYAVVVEAANDITSTYAIKTVHTSGMTLLNAIEVGVDCSESIPHPFVDVPGTSFAFNSVGCIYELEVTTGTSPTTYAPANFVTRAQMAAFIARFIESITGEPCSGAHPFTDVDPSSFAYGPVGCIFDLGVTKGTSATTYGPNDFVTREQMAAFVARVYRLLTGEDCSIPSPFPDGSPASFAYNDVGCIGSLGVTQGTSPTTYSPANLVTREQMAAFLERLYNILTS